MNDLQTFSQESIEQLVINWFKKLDVHAPMVEFLPMLFDKELEMIFPEATVCGYAGFEGWFQRVIRTFFDTHHTVKQMDADIQGGSAIVKIVVQWEASIWNAPEPKSKRIQSDAYQTWIMKPDMNGKPVICRYTVDDLKYHKGSATL